MSVDNTKPVKRRTEPRQPRYARGMQFTDVVERADSMRFCANVLAEILGVPEWKAKESHLTRTLFQQGAGYKRAPLANDKSGPTRKSTRAALSAALDKIA